MKPISVVANNCPYHQKSEQEQTYYQPAKMHKYFANFPSILKVLILKSELAIQKQHYL